METELPRKHCMSLWIRSVFLYPSLLSSLCVFSSLFAFQSCSPLTSLSLTHQLLSVTKSCVEGNALHKWTKWREDGLASVRSKKKKNGEGGHLFWKVRRLGFKSNATYWNRKEMLIDIQKIMMTRMMQGTDEWKDWSWKRELQRQRKRVSWWKGRGEVIDFCSLWCLWYLFNHAATLIQAIWFNCAW